MCVSVWVCVRTLLYCAVHMLAHSHCHLAAKGGSPQGRPTHSRVTSWLSVRVRVGLDGMTVYPVMLEKCLPSVWSLSRKFTAKPARALA